MESLRSYLTQNMFAKLRFHRAVLFMTESYISWLVDETKTIYESSWLKF